MAKLKLVRIQLDDAERHLGYNMNAIGALEEATGENPFTAEFWNTLGPKKLRALVWAGLLHASPAITLDEVGALMIPGEIGEYERAITEAWSGNNPAPKADATPPPPAA